MKSRKGSDSVISVYWFVILIIVAGGIVLMANTFYSSPYDVRSTEATILASSVANCVYFGGEMNPDLISVNGVFRQDFKDHFLQKCNLTFVPGKSFAEEQYYIQLDFSSFENPENKVFTLSAGNNNWVGDCSIDSKKTKLPVCINDSFIAKGPTGKLYLVNELSIVNKVNQNEK